MAAVGANAFANRHPVSARQLLANQYVTSVPSLLQAIDNKNEEEAKNSDAESVTNSAEEIPRGGAVQMAKPPPTPSLTDFRKFALPCLGLWVAQPLLSLVDTVFVGLSGDAATSASQLAALGPATTFFDGATYLFAFLNVATTNLYSSARAQRGEQSDKAESVVRTASRVAMRCGIGLFFFLMAFSRPLMAIYIGKRSFVDQTLQHHWKVVRQNRIFLINPLNLRHRERSGEYTRTFGFGGGLRQDSSLFDADIIVWRSCSSGVAGWTRFGDTTYRYFVLYSY
jgi:hypothetical protein